MYNFTLQMPTRIHFGKGQISHLSELKESGSKVLLVYGGGSIKRNGIYDAAMKILKKAGLAVEELSGVEPNPKIETVRRGEAPSTAPRLSLPAQSTTAMPGIWSSTRRRSRVLFRSILS